jgi:hypothetical protein
MDASTRCLRKKRAPRVFERVFPSTTKTPTDALGT